MGIVEIKTYKNDDYTARRVEYEDGKVTFFVKYNSVTNATDEYEFSAVEFERYYGESKRKFQTQTRADKRHRSDKTLDDFEKTEQRFPHVPDFSRNADVQMDVERVIATCTPTQRERFSLYYDYGFTFREIAAMAGCDESAVRRSVNAVEEKIKNIF